MNKKILKYSIEQLLEDEYFLSWVLHNKYEKEWREFFVEYPDFYRKAIKARKIIELLEDKQERLDDSSVSSIWRNIELFNTHYNRKVKRIYFRKIFLRAASILLIFSLGIMGYSLLEKRSLKYEFSSSIENSENEGRIVLSCGKEFKLKREESVIKIDKRKEQVVVNDSIVNFSSEIEAKKPLMNEVAIPYGKKTELLLADGTQVWLNAGSKLAFPSVFTGDSREVFLEGEACFDVVKDKEHPFIVNTGNVNIEVLGTYFDVVAYSGEKTIETILLEGSVLVKNRKLLSIKENEIILSPGQRASINKKNAEIEIFEEPEIEHFISWTYGWLNYDNESLEIVFRKLERYYNVEFYLPEYYPADDRISGKLDLKSSFEQVMRVLGDAAEFNYRIDNNKIFIEKKIKMIPDR